MYIQRIEATVSRQAIEEAKESEGRVHEFLRTMPGFRWAMLLGSLETPDKLAAVSMWLSPEQASAQEGSPLGAGKDARGYDVTTARGSMTPATHVALVEWQVDDAVADRFVSRWNAAFHAIEDRIGSRLLRDLDAPGRYTGLHAATAEANLDLETLAKAISDAEGLSVTPEGVARYEVVLLTEA